jgi:hypothetical protein
VDLKAGPDDVEKRKFLTLPGLKLRPLCRPACNQSLSRLLDIPVFRGNYRHSGHLYLWSFEGTVRKCGVFCATKLTLPYQQCRHL